MEAINKYYLNNGTIYTIKEFTDEDSKEKKKFPVNIAAEIEDKYVIKVAETVIAVTYNNENYAMSNPVYALISKDDFWNGNNNYQAFSIVN